MYFSDSTGAVYQKDLNSIPDEPEDAASDISADDSLKLVYQSASEPRALSVDWLHHKLYVAENNKVRRTKENMIKL